MINNKIRQRTGIRAKVFIGFWITLSAVIIAGYITFESSTKLLDSLVILSKPDTELKRTGNVLAFLSGAESDIRVYTLTRDYYYFEAYSDNIDSVTRNLADLKVALTDSKSATNRIDSIIRMLNDRFVATNAYIAYLNKTDGNIINKRTLRKLAASHKDSLTAKIQTKSTTIIRYDTLKPTYTETKNDRGPSSFFGRVGNIFKKKEKRKSKKTLTEKPSILANTQITTDSSIIMQPDTAALEDVAHLLRGLQDEQSRKQKVMTQKELDLLRSSALIIAQVMNVVKQIEVQRSELRARKMTEARNIASESIQIIYVVVAFALAAIIFFLILIFRSVARSNSYQRQLIESKQRAEQLARVKEEFLANMSHEIRTPLTAIQGFSEQLSKSDLNKSQREHLSIVQKSSEHLLATVNDILDFSRIGAGKLTFEHIPFSEQEVINEVFETLKAGADAKGLRFEIETTESSEEHIVGDPFRLKQLLLNLAGNAIKFTNDGSVIIRSERIPQTDGSIHLKLSVSDTGIGIAQEKLSLIFDYFSQADTSSTRKYGGSGLGLSICKHLVEMQNGYIEVESIIDQGSTFTAVIPFKLFDGTTAESPEPTFAKDLLVGKKLLLVDDDAFNILLTRIIIENFGMSVEVAVNGAEGFKKAKSGVFDIILTDVQMPEINGMELTRMIRQLPDKKKANVPIVAFTANSATQNLEILSKSGINEYIFKPFKENEVYDKILDVLSISHTQTPHDKIKNDEDQQEPAGLYNLTQIRKFAGDNTETLKNIIHSFIDQTQENLKTLENSTLSGDWQTAGELAHKMLTSMGHFGVNDALESLQILDKNRTATVDPLLSRGETIHLREIVDLLIPQLLDEIREDI
jgi:signal transduction histidine kinase/CheY-like chemotaxis protein/CHASE3 domain sensor protein